MINLMFIVLGEISSGELTIAKSFADSLSKEKFKCHFLINENDLFIFDDKHEISSLNLLDEKNFNKRKFEKILEHISFDYLLLFDVFTIEYAQNWTGISLNYLKGKEIPMIGLDEYNYYHTGYSLDYYGGFTKKLPPLLEMCDFIIANCPLNKPLKDEKNIKYFRLYENTEILSDKDKKEIRNELGILPHQKMIFFTLSKWETLNVFKMNTLEKWIHWKSKMLRAYINECGKDIVVVHIGHGEWEKDENINYKYFKNLNKEDFEKYLLSSDIYMGFNIVSITLTKAVLGEIPSIIFQNDKVIHFEKLKKRIEALPDWYKEMAENVKIAYPFKASTFGWYHFLKPVLENNIYTKSFITTQFFKYSQTLEELNSIIFNEEKREQIFNGIKEFKNYYKEIPSAEEVMDEIIKERRD